MNRLVIATALLVLSTAVRADFVVFDVLSGKFPIVFEGTVNTNTNSAMLKVRHPLHGELILPKDQCKVFKAKNPIALHRAELKAAAAGDDIDKLWRLALESVRWGLPGNYFRAAEIIIEKNPEHQGAKQALRLMELIDKPIPESKSEEDAFYQQAEISPPPGARFARSNHFLILHNTNESPKPGKRQPPLVEQRLDTLEKVYRAFFAYFWSRGYEIEIPKERLFVVLYNRHSEFRQAADAISAPATAVGFYAPKRHVSYFFEFRGMEVMDKVKEATQKMRRIGNDRSVANRGDFIRMAKAFDALMEDYCEMQDLATISHEGVHHLCAASNLLPRDAGCPRWIWEGLGLCFETSKSTGWTGIGLVNDEQIAEFRNSANEVRQRGGINFIGTDGIFNQAGNDAAVFAAYSQSWAFTQFLMEKHFDKLMALCKRYQTAPRVGFVNVKPEVHQKYFDSVFPPSERDAIQNSFYSYMSGIKTELEKAGYHGRSGNNDNN